MTKVLVQSASHDDREIIENLMQLYSHDLSEYQPASLDNRGLFGLGSYFDVYWQEPDRFPFLIRVDDQLAGFAFIRKVGDLTYSVAEFFIIRRFRRIGIGSVVANQIFDKFRGMWEVAELEQNKPAQRFWRAVIREYTNGKFTEEWSTTDTVGPKQIFANNE